ncbi:hypothetical protein OROGR_025035 [Orobanche gracilis]
MFGGRGKATALGLRRWFDPGVVEAAEGFAKNFDGSIRLATTANDVLWLWSRPDSISVRVGEKLGLEFLPLSKSG